MQKMYGYFTSAMLDTKNNYRICKALLITEFLIYTYGSVYECIHHLSSLSTAAVGVPQYLSMES